MSNKLLKEITKSWKPRLKAKKYTVKRFCYESGISYNTFYHLKNPTIGLLDRIEREICAIEKI